MKHLVCLVIMCFSCSGGTSAVLDLIERQPFETIDDSYDLPSPERFESGETEEDAFDESSETAFEEAGDSNTQVSEDIVEGLLETKEASEVDTSCEVWESQELSENEEVVVADTAEFGETTRTDFEDFAIDVGDPGGHLLQGTIFRPQNTPAPLVVLVHGLGCTRYTWQAVFGLIDVLLQEGFTVAAYDQRGHGASKDLAFDIPEMARDIGRVIAHLDLKFGSGDDPWVDASRPVGLVGHSLGAYMVTIASCQNLGFLGPVQGRLGVTIEGAGPDNLQELKEFLDIAKGQDFLVNLFFVGLGAYQVTGTPSEWWVNWTNSGAGVHDDILFAIYSAPNPIERGHGDGVSTLDNADFILTPFYVAHSLTDDVVPAVPPLSTPSDLYNDVRYNSGGPFGTWLEVNKDTGYHTWSLVGHNIYDDPDVVKWVIQVLKTYLLSR